MSFVSTEIFPTPLRMREIKINIIFVIFSSSCSLLFETMQLKSNYIPFLPVDALVLLCLCVCLLQGKKVFFMFERKWYLSGSRENNAGDRNAKKKRASQENIPRVTFFLRNMSWLFQYISNLKTRRSRKEEHAKRKMYSMHLVELVLSFTSSTCSPNVNDIIFRSLSNNFFDDHPHADRFQFLPHLVSFTSHPVDECLFVSTVFISSAKAEMLSLFH